MTRPSYETWLANAVGLGKSDGGFIVGTRNAYVSEMLETQMYSLIADTMERVLSRPTEIRFVVMAGGETYEEEIGDEEEGMPAWAPATRKLYSLAAAAELPGYADLDRLDALVRSFDEELTPEMMEGLFNYVDAGDYRSPVGFLISQLREALEAGGATWKLSQLAKHRATLEQG